MDKFDTATWRKLEKPPFERKNDHSVLTYLRRQQAWRALGEQMAEDIRRMAERMGFVDRMFASPEKLEQARLNDLRHKARQMFKTLPDLRYQ